MAELMHEITPTPSAQYRAELEEFERDNGRPAFILNMAELKLLSIAGVRHPSGFFLVINL